jgi:Tol biopolymer transport system component
VNTTAYFTRYIIKAFHHRIRYHHSGHPVHSIGNHSKADDKAPTWSPDSKFIAFVSNRDGNLEIYVMNADGTNQQRLTYTSAEEGWPTWSPDSRFIAFFSNPGSTSSALKTEM